MANSVSIHNRGRPKKKVVTRSQALGLAPLDKASSNASVHGERGLDRQPSSPHLEFHNYIHKGKDTCARHREDTSPTLSHRRTTTHTINNAQGCTPTLSTRTHSPSGDKYGRKPFRDAACAMRLCRRAL